MSTGSSLSLRSATPADAPLIAAIHAASWQATYRGLMSDEFLERAIDERAPFWAARMNAPDAAARLVLIAELAGEAVGFVCAEQRAESPWGALLDNLHALPAHQGIGCGKLLIRAAQDWAREHGEEQIHLFVLDGNAAAIRFYERQGWTFSGSEVHRLGGTDVTAHRYVFTLTQLR